MIVTKDYIKNIPPGVRMIINCKDLPELDSTYQTALVARKDLHLTKKNMRVSRWSKDMTIEIERYRN